jgi:hypothetical protein
MGKRGIYEKKIVNNRKKGNQKNSWTKDIDGTWRNKTNAE